MKKLLLLSAIILVGTTAFGNQMDEEGLNHYLKLGIGGWNWLRSTWKV